MNGFFRHIIAIAAAVTLGFIATCQAGDIDACKLVSADQASKILGTTITVHAVDTSAAGPGAASMCHYAGTGIGSGFMLIAGHLDYADAAKEIARRKKEAVSEVPPGLPMPSFTDIEGLGDAAYLATATGYFQLHVLAHHNVIVINRNAAASAKAVEQVKRIAQAALANLE